MISKSSPETASNTSCEELYIANEKLARKCLLRFFPALANDEDVLQTARLALWRACQDFKPGKWQLSTLAYTYIRRDIIKEWRSSKRTKRAQETISLSTLIRDKSGSEYELEEVLPGAKNVDWCDSKAWWDSLTDRQREILRYRYDGKTYREIAKILGYSHTLIENEVRIAHKEAKRYL